MHNGQGTGDTEDGAYTLLGANPLGVTRNSGAEVFLTSEDEWYKAAYHHPFLDGGDGDDYWLYPTGSNSDPFSDQPPGSDPSLGTNTANFRKHDGLANGYDDGYALSASNTFSSTFNYLTGVGAYFLADSYYGTFDQGGNVYEWNEAILGTDRGIRGASWGSTFPAMAATAQFGSDPFAESEDIGFRLAALLEAEDDPELVPEPSTLALTVLGFMGLGLFVWRRRTNSIQLPVFIAMFFPILIGHGTVLASQLVVSVPIPDGSIIGGSPDPRLGPLPSISGTISVPQFNPSLGTLTGITFDLTGSIFDTTTHFKFVDTAPVASSATIFGSFTTRRPDTTLINSVDFNFSQTYTVPFNVTMSPPIPVSLTDSVVSPPPASDLSLFTGLGAVGIDWARTTSVDLSD